MTDEAARYRAAINELVDRVRDTAKRRNVKPEHISKLVFSDRRKLAALASGGSLRPETLSAAHETLDKLEASQVAA